MKWWFILTYVEFVIVTSFLLCLLVIEYLKITCWGCLMDFMVRVGQQRVGVSWCIFFFLSLISGVRIMFIGCKVVASNAR